MAQISIRTNGVRSGSAALAAEQAAGPAAAARHAAAAGHIAAGSSAAAARNADFGAAADRGSNASSFVAVPNLTSRARRERIFTPRPVPVAASADRPSGKSLDEVVSLPSSLASGAAAVNIDVPAPQTPLQPASNLMKHESIPASTSLQRFFKSVFSRSRNAQ